MTESLPVAPGKAGAVEPEASWTEVLRGGDRIRIRPIHEEDAAMERRFIEELSPASRRFRFLDTMRSPSDALLKQLTVIDPATDVAYVAVVDDESQDHQIGVARFSAEPGGGDCEFAVAVSDKWQNKGLGMHLMHHLMEAARQRGIAEMHSSDASDNDLMRRFAEQLHLDHRPDPDDATQVLYSMKLGPRRQR
ncbi:GNAT family N-acetyltransferase [Variovorax sp. J22R24]|uniref:GNAT family N-acetyltransferase n=1 Tax=Variovorax gracilis TaxID=3053502 RepID=UPI002576C9C6|nr:GNAT family N-acetyltransferase [Variovorax sp. J22R24]MDM0109591.1 GNAT family N-acetyltransferase [Variovorax sp. J22R24]